MKQHTKTLGQVFLTDKNIIDKIITFASPESSVPIIEIGCGKGILTQALAKIGPVYIIEIDQRWSDYVKSLKLDNITIFEEDVLKVNFSEFPNNSPIIANIPYQITTPLIEHLIKYKYCLGSITIMVQKEMAGRLIAQPGSKDYGAMSIFCQYHFTIKKGFSVSRNCFNPKPNVDSYVLKLTAKKPCLPDTLEPLFFAMTRTFFWGRRKTMLTCLKSSPYIELISKLTLEQQIKLKQRGESLSLIELIKLFNDINQRINIKESSNIK